MHAATGVSLKLIVLSERNHTPNAIYIIPLKYQEQADLRSTKRLPRTGRRERMGNKSPCWGEGNIPKLEDYATL